MQPPSSLDDGLENQSVKFLFLSFNCPTKALMFLILTLLERLRALCLSSTSNKTLLRLKAGSTPQDVSTSTVAFAAVSLDIAKTFIARSPRSFDSTPKDWNCKRRRSYADTFHTRSEQPIENLALVDWMETFEFYALQLFRSASSHSQNVVISEQSIGRQKPLNCLCEGLLVFFVFQSTSQNHCKFHSTCWESIS